MRLALLSLTVLACLMNTGCASVITRAMVTSEDGHLGIYPGVRGLGESVFSMVSDPESHDVTKDNWWWKAPLLGIYLPILVLVDGPLEVLCDTVMLPADLKYQSNWEARHQGTREAAKSGEPSGTTKPDPHPPDALRPSAEH
jgi:uncharacterized protein YceK